VPGTAVIVGLLKGNRMRAAIRESDPKGMEPKRKVEHGGGKAVSTEAHEGEGWRR
jgi:hypothetical protein